MDSLWIDFVNSDFHDHLGRPGADRDRLREPAWVRRFLEDRGLPRIDARRPEVHEALRELRDLLQQFVRTLVEDRPLAPGDLDRLNGYLACRPVTSSLEVKDDSFRLRLTPASGGLDAVLFAIAESFAAFLVEGDPERLKACENPDCRWVFYDTTRSRTRRWCADTCGNLVKVRKFREKKKRKKMRSEARPARQQPHDQ
jgi:predicted RNA-binding Zn ribbon-like protein